MFETNIKKRLSATMLVAALSMVLTGCFVTPGKFDSTLVLNKDESFSFTYTGEIFFLGLSQMAMMGDTIEPEFYESSCYDDDSFDERECTKEELAQQRADWDAGQEERKASKEKEAKEMAAMLGGIDPTDPEAGKQLAVKLERQRGWNSVEYVGDGLFNVDFAINGMLSHDISFPVMENIPVPKPFVQVVLRKGNQVRVNAPAFAADETSNPMAAGMAGMMAGLGNAMSEGGEEAAEEAAVPAMPVMQGTFTILTDGQILANNTDEGPSDLATGQAMIWEVSPMTKAAPTALIKLGN